MTPRARPVASFVVMMEMMMMIDETYLTDSD
jgi:hypothetical protein